MKKCSYCGQEHETRCSLVKSIEYWEDGQTIRKIEFFSNVELYPQQNQWTGGQWIR